MKFNIGDRVVLRKDAPDHNYQLHAGSTGTVMRTLSHSRVGVCWDNITNGHGLDNTAPDDVRDRGWYVYEHDIELLESFPLDIPDGDIEALLL